MNIACMNRQRIFITKLLAELRHYVVQYFLTDMRQHQIIHVSNDGTLHTINRLIDNAFVIGVEFESKSVDQKSR
jgi:hypothetical protein